MWAFLFAIVWLLIGWAIGYLRGREDGREAERRDVRFTPVDKIEPREGYHPPLSDPAWNVLHDIFGEPQRGFNIPNPQQNSGPKLQGHTNRGDPYRHYELEDL